MTNDKPQGNSNMSVAEADHLLRSAGYMRGTWDYLKDHHFADFIYMDITSLEDVEAFLVKLDKDHEDHTEPGPFRWGCAKAKGIRECLAKDFWKENADHLRMAMSRNRRTHCSCHEVGSFKRRDELPDTHDECLYPGERKRVQKRMKKSRG